jgi:hypothetical protein
MRILNTWPENSSHGGKMRNLFTVFFISLLCLPAYSENYTSTQKTSFADDLFQLKQRFLLTL